MSQQPFFFPNPRRGGHGRIAAILLAIIGGLTLILCTCAGTLAFKLPEFLDMVRQQGMASPLPQGYTVDEVRTVYAVMAIGSAVAGIVLLLLAVFVRRASKAAAIIAMVVLTFMCLMTVLSIIGGLASGGGTPALGLAILLCVAMVCLMGFTMFKLMLVATSTAPPPGLTAKPQWAGASGMGYGYGIPPQWMPPPGAPPVGIPMPPPPPQDPQPPAGQ